MGLSEHLNIKSLPAHFSITKVIWMIAPRRIHISACYFFNHKVICFFIDYPSPYSPLSVLSAASCIWQQIVSRSSLNALSGF